MSPATPAFQRPEPKTREEWAALMQRARRQGHPHRRARHPARQGAEAARQVRQHLVGRGLRLGGPAAGGARLRHPREGAAAERPPPRLRLRRGDLSGAARRRHQGALLDADRAGPARLPGHPQRGDLDRRLLHGPRRRQGRVPADLPLRLSPLRRCRAVAARDGRQRLARQKTWKILDENEIVDGVDELGVLLYGHAKNAYWYGSSLSIEDTRKLAPYQNATGLQVTSAVLAGIVWMLENPDRGITEADEMDFRRCLEIQRPYLGKVFGTYTDWTPLAGPPGTVSGGDRQAAIPGSSATCWCAEQAAQQTPRITPGLAPWEDRRLDAEHGEQQQRSESQRRRQRRRASPAMSAKFMVPVERRRTRWRPRTGRTPAG